MAESNQIKLSIVVPFYKTEAYLPRCLDSLLNQTLKEIEIICVNDGSPDGCLELLKTYQRKYSDIIKIVDKNNAGLWNARWSGTEVARGKYVAYVDSDDYVDVGFATDFYSTAMANDADIVVCGFNRISEEDGACLSTELAERRTSFFAHSNPGRLIEINPAAWNKCFRRDLLNRMHRLASPPQILEDVTLSQLAYLSSNKSVAFTGTAPYNYMIRSGSMINSVTVPQVDSIKKSLLEVAKFFDDEKVTPEFRQSLDATVFLHLGISMSFRLSCNPQINLSEQIKLTTFYLDEHFPTWRRSAYINFSYALSHSSAYKRLWLSQTIYKLHLIKPFLAAYRFFLAHANCDIKW